MRVRHSVIAEIERNNGETAPVYRQGGLPWLVVLDAEGKEIDSSNAEPGGGNIGAPVQPDECAWLGVMMERSRGDKVTREQLAVMLADLEEFAKPKRR